MTDHPTSHRPKSRLSWGVLVCFVLVLIAVAMQFDRSWRGERFLVLHAVDAQWGDCWLTLRPDETGHSGVLAIPRDGLRVWLDTTNRLDGRVAFAYAGRSFPEPEGEAVASHTAERRLAGEYDEQAGTFRATWRSAEGEVIGPLEFRTWFAGRSVCRERGVRWDGRGFVTAARAFVPELPGRNPFFCDVNRRLREEARDFNSTFIRRTWQRDWTMWTSWEDLWSPSTFSDFEQTTLWVIEHATPTLVSVSADSYAYTGGAHGNTDFVAHNFVLRNGELAELRLAELFRPDSGWQTVLHRACIAELEEMYADWPPDEDKPAESTAPRRSFVVTPAGLRLFFAPYEVGPYAAGSFIVLVPWEKLRSVLAEDGVAAQIALRPRLGGG